jgi:hypothetical protein
LDGVIVMPYNPDTTRNPQEDLGTRCYDFKVGPGQARAFEVDNSHPGGEPRTIGYWKNWNGCTSGNQSATAQKNGGAAAGFFLVEDLLPQLVGDQPWLSKPSPRRRERAGTPAEGGRRGHQARGRSPESRQLPFGYVLRVRRGGKSECS